MTTDEDIQNSDLIDWVIFSELLAMDEDEEGFSKGLVTTFVEQAMGIYQEIETIIDNSNNRSPSDEELVKLSSLGHYLKGSAAALGLRKVQYQCERIQNYGNKKLCISEDTTNSTNNNNSNSNKSTTTGTSSTNTATNTQTALGGGTTPETMPQDNNGWLKLIEDALNISKLEFSKTREILSGYFNEQL